VWLVKEMVVVVLVVEKLLQSTDGHKAPPPHVQHALFAVRPPKPAYPWPYTLQNFGVAA
jgi:hypothetical protein